MVRPAGAASACRAVPANPMGPAPRAEAVVVGDAGIFRDRTGVQVLVAVAGVDQTRPGTPAAPGLLPPGGGARHRAADY
ncbi:hypothetical protein A5659_00785 [Mycobacterium sp. 1165196.3]|nr:hypothetical protein A5659_00785 [Mycobacterium sp. 1165196.3]